jgi:YD repeat-containing protein
LANSKSLFAKDGFAMANLSDGRVAERVTRLFYFRPSRKIGWGCLLKKRNEVNIAVPSHGGAKMNPRILNLSAGILALIALLAVPTIFSYAQPVNYSYDDLNRLTRVDYGDMVIAYTYDDMGSRATEAMRHPPITTASPPGGVYKASLSVSLTCTDPQGPGCDRIYYTTDGTVPTTASKLYSSPIVISTATNLKFFGRDLEGVSERVKSQSYVLAVVGDVNGDGKVDCSDLGIVKASVGKRCGQASFDSRADLNQDCVVDVRDFATVARQIPAGSRCP